MFARADAEVAAIDSVSRSAFVSHDCVVTGANACGPAVSGISVLDNTYQSSEALDFIVRFEDGEPSTDLADEVGQLDFFNVLGFLRRVDAGCP